MDVRKVLMVDDEDDIRKIGEVSLSMVGQWQTVLARSGTEGVALAAAERPDVILLDVMMPEVDGPATLRRLRDEPTTSAIPVIFMTAKVQKSEVSRYLELGAAGVIPKPFDPMALPSQILKIMEAR